MTGKSRIAHAFTRIGLLLGLILPLIASSVLSPTATATHTPAHAREQAEKIAMAMESLGLKPNPELRGGFWMKGSKGPGAEYVSVAAGLLTTKELERIYENRRQAYFQGGYKGRETLAVGLDQEAVLAIPSNFPVPAETMGGEIYSLASAEGLFRCGNVSVHISVNKSTSAHKKPPRSSPELDALQDRLAKEGQTLNEAAKATVKGLLPQVASALLANDACKVEERLPIIFIPGVAGSKLYKDSALGPGQLWPLAPIESRVDLALASDGVASATGANIVVGDALRDTGVDLLGALNFYGSIVKFLEGKGWKEKHDLEVFPYDWRLDNHKHLDALDRLINAIRTRTGKKKVILIAHSLGGLIARDYVYDSAERASKVDSFITMGTPYWGSPKVYYGLISGYQFGNPFVRKPLMKILAQNMPAAYQLMPWVPFIQDSVSGKLLTLEESYDDIRFKGFEEVRPDRLLPGLLTDDYVETRDNVWRLNPTLIRQAASFRARVGTKQSPKPLPAGVKQYVIIGQGVRTLGHYELKDWEAGRIFRFVTSIPGIRPWKSYLELANGRKVVLQPYFHDGDGTVPLWSLETSTATRSFYVPYDEKLFKPGDPTNPQKDSTAHGDLPNSKRVQMIVGALVDKEPPDPSLWQKKAPKDFVEVEGGWSSFIQGTGYSVDFTLYSDAHLRIADESGGALGFDDEGVIEETQATGTFLEIDGAEYASLADPLRAYDIQVKGVRDGKFTLVVDIAKEGKVTTFYYPEVPVKKGTSAHFKLDLEQTTTTFPELQVTTDGRTSKVSAQVPPPGATTAVAVPATAGGSGPPSASVPSTTDGRSPAYWVGYWLGYYLVIVLALALPVGGVVWLLRRRRRPGAGWGGPRYVGEERASAVVETSTPAPGPGNAAAGSGVMICPKCRAEARPEAKFCGYCGAKLGGRSCPQCNSEVEPGARFCGYCGQTLGGGVAEPRIDRPEAGAKEQPARKRRSRLVWVAPLLLALLVAPIAFVLWRGDALPAGLFGGAQTSFLSALGRIDAIGVPAKAGGSPTPSLAATRTPIAATQVPVKLSGSPTPGLVAKPTQMVTPRTPTPARRIATPTPLPLRPTPTTKPQQPPEPYYILVLTNAGDGLYIGTEESLKNRTRCSFTGGGINCGPTDLVTYEALLGPFSTLQEARAALCANITQRREFPLGVGLKGRWGNTDVWFGLWNNTVTFDCSKL
ncbi:MAG: alpha/beta fold hydrolase [Chloroflexi bacterium]|nr:alpha/beta fold hydrolase [Chloroflexota bacterium]